MERSKLDGNITEILDVTQATTEALKNPKVLPTDGVRIYTISIT